MFITSRRVNSTDRRTAHGGRITADGVKMADGVRIIKNIRTEYGNAYKMGRNIHAGGRKNRRKTGGMCLAA